jgi:peptidoglycan/LPS O-acetylase OafA/YrhL
MAGVTPISAVFWTLCLEVQFYIVFALTQWSADRMADLASTDAARRERWRTAVWTAWGMLVLMSIVGALDMPMWRGSFLSFWYSFVAGVLCGLALVQGRSAVAVATVYAASVALSGWAHAEAYTTTAGLTALFVIVLSRWPALQPALTKSVLAGLLGSGLAADLLALPVSLAACIGVAVLVYLGIERAAIGWSRGIKFRRGDDSPGLARA